MVYLPALTPSNFSSSDCSTYWSNSRQSHVPDRKCRPEWGRRT
jgi:hypothetical protein